MPRLHSRFARRWFALATVACVVGFGLMLLFYVNAPRTSNVIPAATATIAPSTFAIVASLTTSTPVKLQEVPTPTFEEQVTSIHIVGDPNPMKSGYFSDTLQRNGDQFDGQGYFGCDVCRPSSPFRAVAISIPVGAARIFLQLLAQSIVQKSPSPPTPTNEAYCDPPPYLAIELHTLTKTIKFETQNCDSPPWRITSEKSTFVTYSDLPTQAWRIISPYTNETVEREKDTNAAVVVTAQP